MSAGALRLVAVRLFAAACRLFPRGFREAHGHEMAVSFGRALDARLERGEWAGAAYALRSSWDAAREGARERMRGGRTPSGHGRSPAVRGSPGGAWSGLTADVRVALRGLRHAPGFALVAVVVVALGVGANTAVFSALRVAVLAPPPYPEPDRLVVADLTRQVPREPPAPMSWSFPKYLTFVEGEGRMIDPAVGYASRAATLTGLGPAEMVTLEVVTPGYFELLGRRPPLGRPFAAEELRPGQSESVVVSWELWHSRLGDDPDVLGRRLALNGIGLEIVGVATEGFDGLTGGAQLWIPMGVVGRVFSPFMVEEAGAHWFYVLGRLVPGATLEEARAQMVAIGDGLSETYPPPNASRVYSGSARALTSVRSNDDARAAVVLLSIAAALVLLVACANLSGLLLARARRKARDGAVRAAVGASRWRLVRASLVESLLLAGAGGAVGVLVAMGGTRGMAAAWPTRFLEGQDGTLRVMDPGALGVDATSLGFALVVTLLTGVAFGVVPALRAARVDLGERLRRGGGPRRRERTVLGLDAHALLVGVQVAMALVLVIGTGLLTGSTLRLLDVDEGFDTESLVSFNYTIPLTSASVDDPLAFHERLLARVRGIPGVTGATFGCAPLRGHCIVTRVDAVEGGPEIPAGQGPEIGVRMVDEEHFAALGIPLLRGRAFDRSDGDDASPAVVISELAARTLFPDSDALGRRVRLGISSSDRAAFSEVVGVVGDVLYSRPDEGFMAEAYYSFREFPESHGSVTVRTAGDPLSYVAAIRAALAEVDPDLALFRVETMDDAIGRSIGDRGATLGLLGLFALVTLLLAATGTWGVVAYAVSDRRRELGLRLALGAGERRVLGGVLAHGVRTALFGIGLGVVGGRAVAGVLERLLWETEPTDPLVYAGGALVLFTVVLVASWVPGRTATRLDPVEALRAE